MQLSVNLVHNKLFRGICGSSDLKAMRMYKDTVT